MTKRPDKISAATRPEMQLGPLEDMFGYLLGRAWRDATRTFSNHFASLGLTSRQFATLILIDENMGCTPGDLVGPVGISQNNLVSVIDDLIARGWVVKSTSLHDKRARVLALTPQGKQLLARAHATHANVLADYRQRIGNDDLEALAKLLRRFDRG